MVADVPSGELAEPSAAEAAGCRDEKRLPSGTVCARLKAPIINSVSGAELL